MVDLTIMILYNMPRYHTTARLSRNLLA